MFIGHYGVSLAAKRFAPRTPLATLFVAVQLLDLVFASMVLLGVEKLRIVHGFTRANPYDLYFMPYSHSLAGAVLWSALAALAYGIAVDAAGARQRVLAALVVGAAVVSHFVLDLPMHTPDLPLGFGADSPKVGLGLWNQLDVTVILEVGVFAVGAALYFGATRPRPSRGNGVSIGVCAALAVLAVATPFLPDPPDARVWAVQALAVYGLLAYAAHAVDRTREPAIAGA